MKDNKHYSIKEVFRTIQGEGHHAGTAALFIRFAGCNMWSGWDEDRIRDAKRNDAECPRWCDTDFTPEGARLMTATELVDSIRGTKAPLIVLTGGEPLLQIDDDLINALHTLDPQPLVCIETNGTVSPRFNTQRWLSNAFGSAAPIVWLTMSPKRDRARTVLLPEWVSELKLVVPAYDPKEWDDWPGLKFIQPQANKHERDLVAERVAARWVSHGDGKWRLSLQQHKIAGIP